MALLSKLHRSPAGTTPLVCASLGFALLFGCQETQNPFKVAPDVGYPDTLVAYAGEPIDSIVPTFENKGYTDSFSVNTSLPEGLLLGETDGCLTGTPLGPPSVTTHTITVCNEYGCTDDPVTVVVCPAKPSGVQANSTGCGVVSITWDSVEGADGYNVYRGAASGLSCALLGAVSAPPFHDTIGVSDTVQWKYVVATTSDLTPPSRPSDTANVTVPASCDSTPPAAPVVQGPSVTGDRSPTWTWSSGGDGSGVFRWALDTCDATLASAPDRATSYTPSTGLTEGTHTLYVWESDAVGNWSPPGSCTVTISSTALTAPTVRGSSPTADMRPEWRWSSAGGSGRFRYRLDHADLSAGATETVDTVFRPSEPLTEGAHTLYVQERSSEGAWSSSGMFTITIDPSPTAVALRPITSVTYASMQVAWEQSTASDFQAYKVCFDTLATVGENSTVAATITSKTVTQYTLTDLQPRTRYHVRVYVCDANSCTGSDIDSATTVTFEGPSIAVTAPSLRRDSCVVSSENIVISGTITGSASIASVTATVNGAAVGVLGTSSWSLTASLKNAEWNTLVITARDQDGNQASKTVHLYRRGGLAVPAAPTCAERLCSGVVLDWSSVPGCDRYILMRGQTDETPSVVVAGDITATTYADTGFDRDTSFSYAVRAYYSRTYGSVTVRDTTPLSSRGSFATAECFQGTIGGADDDAGNWITDVDDGWLITATTIEFGWREVARVVRTQRTGQVVTNRTHGSSASSDRLGMGCQLDNGDLMIPGYLGIDRTEGYPEAWMLRLNSSGDTVWTRVFPFGGYQTECSSELYSAIRTPAGVLACGQGNDGVLVVLVDHSGDSLWSREWDWTEYTIASDLASFGSDRVLVATLTNDPAWGICVSMAARDTCWTIRNPFGSTTSSTPYVTTMQDGTVVASGHVIPASGPHKAAAACVTTDGSTVWSRTYEGTTSRTFSDGTASDHGIVLAGRINDDAWLVELDMNGDTLWTRSFGGSGSDAGTSVARADDGGYIMVGSTDSYGAGGTDIYVIKTDCRGNTRGPVRKLD